MSAQSRDASHRGPATPVPERSLAPVLTPRKPALKLPSGTCDTHIHVFGDHTRYPLATERHYTPALCGLDDYRQTANVLGIARAVLVQPSVYGRDNRALLGALSMGGANFRGVVVIGADIQEQTLDQLHDAGVRGVRANLVNSNGLSAADALRLAPRLRERGWHLQLQVAIDTFAGLGDFVSQAGLPVVIDHFGLPSTSDPDTRAFRGLLGLVGRGLCWVKMSAHYRLEDVEVKRLARALARSNPARTLWATDWPHPGLGGRPMPDDAASVDALADWLPDEDQRQQALVDNPSRLYWV